MALFAGTEPLFWNSILTGLSASLYDTFEQIGYVTSEQYSEELTYPIDLEGNEETKTFGETDEAFHKRVLKDKQFCYALANQIISEIQTNGEVAPAQVVTAYIAGVGTSGDTMSAPQGIVTGNVKTPTATPLKLR